MVCSLVLTMFSGCSKDDDEADEELIGNWIELSDFEGVPRSDAVAFTIGDKAYVGTGYDGSDRLNDFWEYGPDVNNWTRKADFPGAPRNGAVGFGTDSKGYIGTGYDGSERLKDFYEYDPTSNAWQKIADFGGSARYGAVAFSANEKGYVGTGDDGNFLKDFWEYDPASGEWTQKISLGGAKRRDAVAFVIDGKGYICTGINNGVYEDDFWEYDPFSNVWNKKRDIANNSDSEYDDDYSGIIGINKIAFSVNGRGYIATGGSGTTGTVVWEYNPTTDLWKQRTSLEASARIDAVGFAIDDLGYITTGRNSSYYFDDLWGFKPADTQKDLDKMSIVAP
ncbi:galactose oxidase [candidate division KSB1 bacterium]|nr:galactose oxidase [candidate division KSB1 bacterium]